MAPPGGELLNSFPLRGDSGVAFSFVCFTHSFYQDRPSCLVVAPDEDENTYLNPSLQGT